MTSATKRHTASTETTISASTKEGEPVRFRSSTECFTPPFLCLVLQVVDPWDGQLFRCFGLSMSEPLVLTPGGVWHSLFVVKVLRDHLPQGILWGALWEYGVPEPLQTIHTLYNQRAVFVFSSQGELVSIYAFCGWCGSAGFTRLLLQCALELFAARSEAALRSVHEFMRVPEIDCWISADCGGKEEAESPFTISFWPCGSLEVKDFRSQKLKLVFFTVRSSSDIWRKLGLEYAPSYWKKPIEVFQRMSCRCLHVELRNVGLVVLLSWGSARILDTLCGLNYLQTSEDQNKWCSKQHLFSTGSP